MTIQTEKELQEFLIKKLREDGYPADSIIPEYRIDEYRADIVVLDNDSDIPVLVIECKMVHNNHSVDAAVGQLRRAYDRFDYPVRTYAAVFKGGQNFDLYDFTRKIKDNSIPIEKCLLSEFPPYEVLKKEKKSKLVAAQKKRRKLYINGLRILCWGIIPLIMIVIGVLDAMSLYTLSTERLILIGILILSLVVPFFGQIKLGDITLSHKDHKSNNKKDEDK